MSTFDEAVQDIKKAKSVLEDQIIRIGAGGCLIAGFPIWCGAGLIAAEILGIFEELV